MSFNSVPKEELVQLVTRKSEEIQVLREISNRLSGHFEIDSLLKEIMNYTKKILRSEACSLLLVDEDSEKLFFYVTDDSGADLEAIRIDKGQGIVGAVFESGESTIVNNVEEDPRFFGGVDQQTGFITKSLVCVPMSVGTNCIGVVEVLNRIEGSYTKEDVETLESIASQSALAIEYVRANEKRSFDERLAVVGNMSAAMVHDLRNSMQVISGFSQLIAMEQPQQREYCDVIGREIDKLVQMSQEILEFARGSKISLDPVQISLGSFLKSIHKLNIDRMTKHGCSFRLKLNNDVQVNLDVNKMQRVLQNILNNAIEASVEFREITLEGGLVEGIPQIIVRDRGKGMDDDSLNKIFKPFFSKGKSGGTGLGMAIVKNIVEGHNASITVASQISKGSEFVIKFKE
ncbi:MAG: GAF domain-containing sensor histidine kinase [bacterium]|nr:GAF domain-containing sensor histidine kinase [bacterium]